ncbi:hypothetical protein PS15p_212033 [Mucor circinelloides]
MSIYISDQESDRIFAIIKPDNSNEILWSCFVSEAKQYIMDSWKHFPREDLCRTYWLRYYHNQVAKLGCEANAGYDNWFSVRKLMTASQASTSSSMPPPAASSSSSMPPPAASSSPSMPPPAALLSSEPPPSTVSPTSGSSSSTQSKCTKSSLGTRLSESQRQIALALYAQMDDSQKWRLASGRCVEDVMHNVLITQTYEHPSQYCVLDIEDDNWIDIFTPEERQEIRRLTPAIQYPSMPADMTNFMINIPDTEDLPAIYNYLENIPLDFKTQQHLLWLKHTIQNAIVLIEHKYLPITNQQEEDICTHVWKFIGDAFNSSKLTVKQQKASSASRAVFNKKRRIAMRNPIQRQQHALIPDISIYNGSQTYAVIEAAKTEDDTKQLVETYKKCPEMMAEILSQLVKAHPTEQRTIKIHACILSNVTCSSLMLSNQLGYVKLVSHGQQLTHPEVPGTFKPLMAALLEHFWGFKLAIEAVVDAMAQSTRKNSRFTQK